MSRRGAMPWPEPGQGKRHALAGAGPGEETCLGRSRAQGRDMPWPEPGQGRGHASAGAGQGRRHASARAEPRVQAKEVRQARQRRGSRSLGKARGNGRNLDAARYSGRRRGKGRCRGRSIGARPARPGHSLLGVGCGSPASQATRRPHPRGSLTDIYQPGSRLVCINRTMKRSTSINLP